MRGNRFVNNIVAYSQPEADVIFGYADADHRPLFSEWDHNLYWLRPDRVLVAVEIQPTVFGQRSADLTELDVGNTPEGSFVKWQTAGFDQHSVVADPLFVDWDKDDYRLVPDSPAFVLGFKPIPVERIGPCGLKHE